MVLVGYSTTVLAQQASENRQNRPKTFEAPYLLLGGVTRQLRAQQLNPTFQINESFVGAGYQFSSRWSIETSYVNSDFSLTTNEATIGYRQLNLTAVYRLPIEYAPGFHLRGGLAAEVFSDNLIFDESDSLVHFGLGYTFQLNQNLSLVLAAETNKAKVRNTTEQQATIAIQYRLPSNTIAKKQSLKKHDNKLRASSHETPLDDDRDGINNTVDQCPNTPLHYMVDNQGCKQFIIDNETVTLQINFATDSVDIAPQYEEQIESIARFLRKHSNLTITLEGHTDNTGSAKYNLRLSQKRAEVIAFYLSNKFAIESHRITAIGFGDSKPIATNATPQGQHQNRRVEAKLTVQTEIPILRK